MSRTEAAIASAPLTAGRPALAVEVEALTRIFEPRRGVRRRRGRVVALDRLDLAVEQGEIHGLLGPNGAGKTTLVKVLSTVLLPTAGRAAVLGFDVVEDAAAIRRRCAVVLGGERGLYTRLTARQNLLYWAALYRLPASTGRRRAEALLERFGLRERANDRVETFSRGMKQRLHIARGLIGDPAAIFLDEPSAGLDPIAAREVRTLVAELRGEGRTILLATHDLAEAETLCDRISLVDRGRLLATETPHGLRALAASRQRIDVEGASAELLEHVRDLAGVREVVSGPDGTARVEIVDAASGGAVLERLAAGGATQIRMGPPSLEDVYVEIVGDRGLDL